MAILVITTQVRENYGAHNWNGEGECPQYWKCKGGSEYKVLDIDVSRAKEIFQAVVGRVTHSDDYYEEWATDWFVEDDEWLSWSERGQLEYEGEIVFPEPTIDWQECG